MRSLSSLVLGLGLLLLAASDASAASAHPAYYGGHVVSNPSVVAVSWGPSVDANVVNGMPGFYASILQSPYLDWVSEYSTVALTGVTDGLPGTNQRIGRGTFFGSYTITPSLSGTYLSNTQILDELQAQIAAGNLPAPLKDASGNANTVYMVNFPPGVTITSYGGGVSCTRVPGYGFCGATDTLTVGGNSVGVGLIPDQSPDGGCAGFCGTDPNYFNIATEVHAHALLNLVTNLEEGLWSQEGSGTVQRPVGWYNTGAPHQVADLCTGQPADVNGYTVEMGWSNTQGACVSSASSELAVCTAGTTYCRQCGSTDVGQDGGCIGATALCETDTTNGAFGECVACTTSASCKGTTPVCGKGGPTNDSCRACEGDGECTTNTAGPHCLSSGACGAEAAAASTGSGCSSTSSPASALCTVLALWAVLLRRRSSPQRRAVDVRTRNH
jgi:uncharacterized protein (TIGR03382 family)